MTGERRLDARTTEQMERDLRSRRAELERRARSLTTHVTCQAAELDRVGCQIEQVEAALAQLSQGDYGWCNGCGSFIGLARLAILPFTQRCHACRIAAGADVSVAVAAAVAVASESSL
jgi:RNA polymerase-binding transcription factor DksA